MCGKKSANVTAPEAAAPVSAPLKIDNTAKDTKSEAKNTKAKGKKKLTISADSKGTGVNL